MASVAVKRSGSLLAAVCVALLCHGSAQAESTGGVVISPPFQQVTVGDAKNTTFGVTLTNRTASDQTITATTVDFKSLDESGGVAFLGSEITSLQKKYGLAKWLALDSAPMVIPSGGSKKVTVLLDNRQDLSPGGHYGAIIFKIEGGKSAGSQNSVDVKQVLASLVFAKKLGGEQYDLRLTSIDSASKWAGGDQKLKLRFYNPGNVHVVPRGVVKLIDGKGKVIAKNIINAESGIILPETFRVYPVTFTDVPVLEPGTYKLVAEYRYDGLASTAKFSKDIKIFDWRYAATVGAVASVILVPVLAVAKFAAHRRRKRRKQPRKYHAAF
jgi:hypothetical protein